MDERVIRFRVGVVVLAAGMITIILVLLFGAWPQFLQPQYSIRIGFPRAPGVAVNTPVRKDGVLIGRVSSVELRDEGGVVLTLRIDQKRKLRMNEVCRISAGSLVTGDAVLEFTRDPDNPDDTLIQDGDYLPNGTVASDPFDVLIKVEADMVQAFRSLEAAGNRISEVAGKLDTAVGDEQQLQRIFTKTETALDEFTQTLRSIDEVVGDPELNQRLKQSLDQLPAMFDDARLTLSETRKTMASFEKVSARAEQNLANLERFTEPLGARGEQLVDNIDQSIGNLDALLSQLVQFSEAINRREGSLGKLVYDDELYGKINRAAGNVEEVTRKLRPIANDIRVFTDKIARDPRQLGAKGIFDSRPTGLKTGFR